ncbi:hypothetical protein GC098_16900 [Paenibacillus sp. LMG 31458]|uniref:Uncharacterized protein n=1 Tax=Paenibacillus phytorum TaxID=2654977 RepID=A0ABX1XX29_9BACL|nr:hypothetical protein [Paenibacillus phytorum]NOU73076.1 hypothetical protein [Paenibacillus phytorum]
MTLHKFSLLSDWLSDSTAKSILLDNLTEMNRHVVDKVELTDEFVGFWSDFPTIKVFQMFGQNWLIDRSPEQLSGEMIQNFVLMRRK